MRAEQVHIFRHPSWFRAYVLVAALIAVVVPVVATILSAMSANADVSETLFLLLVSVALGGVAIWAGYPAWLRELRVDRGARTVEFRNGISHVAIRGGQIKNWWTESRPDGERQVVLTLMNGMRKRFPLDWDAIVELRDALGIEPDERIAVEGRIRVFAAPLSPGGQSVIGYALAIVVSALVLAGIRWWVPAAESLGGAIFILLFAAFGVAVLAYGLYLLLSSVSSRIVIDPDGQRITLQKPLRTVSFGKADVVHWGTRETRGAEQPRTDLVVELPGGRVVDHDITGCPEEVLRLVRDVIGSEPARHERRP